MSKLNIYRLSGVPTDDKKQFNIWTAGTDTLTNTRAANFVLAKINMLLSKIQYTTPSADIYNELDMFAVVLEALEYSKKDDDKLFICGYAIQKMIDNGFFNEQSTNEDERVTILDEAIKIFETYVYHGEGSQSGEFIAWYIRNIISNNYNDAPEDASAKLRTYERNSVGSLNPSDYKDLATYVADNGAYFLYLFIGDENIHKYNSTIRKRYRKEKQVYEYMCINCEGVYTEDTVYDMLYAGCTQHYSMTPEQKIEQLKKLGGVGELVTVLTIIGTILSILLSLWTIFEIVFTYVVKIPDDADLGVPNPDDWNIKAAKDSGKSKFPWWLVGVAGLFLVLNKKK